MAKQPIYCLGIATSPRIGGNTAILLEKCLEGAQAAGARTELISLHQYKFSPCFACNGCFKEGKCVVHDDMQIIYEKLLAADRLILAAPIFSMGLCAQAKSMIDRTQRFWATKYILHQDVITDKAARPPRKGLFISTAGSDLHNVFAGALHVAKYFFLMLETELVGSYCYTKIDEKGAALSHPDKLEAVYKAGYSLGLE